MAAERLRGNCGAAAGSAAVQPGAPGLAENNPGRVLTRQLPGRQPPQSARDCFSPRKFGAELGLETCAAAALLISN